MDGHEKLTAFEAVVISDIFAVNDSLIKFSKSVDISEIKVLSRSISNYGFYCDLEVPKVVVFDASDGRVFDGHLENHAVHPNGVDAIFFVLYVKDGTVAFLEASSTSPWCNESSGESSVPTK